MKTEQLYSAVVATIANAASLSGEVDLGGASRIAIQMPAAWTAANLTFQASDESGGTFADVVNDAGTEIVVTATISQVIVIVTALKELAGLRFIKIRSGTSATPVAQGAERVLKVLLK